MKNRGITLIALVITVIILLILAAVAVSMITGNDGLFSQANSAGQAYTDAAIKEKEEIDALFGDQSKNKKVETHLEIPGTVSEITVNIANGMIPVVYNETESSWYVVTKKDFDDSNWYNYLDTSISGNQNKSKWANVMLKDGLEIEGVTNIASATLTDLYGKKVNKESSMFVWIPRFAYKISSGYHTKNAGEILIKFLNTDNTYKDGSSISTNITNPLTNVLNASNNYMVHPAFSWAKEDGTKVELEGFWMGKFEASASNASFTVTQPGNVETSATVILREVGDVASWINISKHNIFLNCYNMNNILNSAIYGISTNKDEIDPHLIKNSEWGAAAYLTYSKYGRNKINGAEMSNLTSQTAGDGDYKTKTYLSSTGNIYGVYDMAGGTWEHTAAYVDSTKNGTVANSYLTSVTYGKALFEAADKYKDVYVAANTDDRLNNYVANSNKYGDGIFETSYTTTNDNSTLCDSGWNQDQTKYPFFEKPFFLRSGNRYSDSYEGIFAFTHYDGSPTPYQSFRVSITTI